MSERFPDELGGKHDFDYIRPSGRRLSEYEAVTCHTQPSAHGGGLQVAGDYILRPDGRSLFDPGSSKVVCEDWYAYRDPNQLWQRTYYSMQSATERTIDATTTSAIETGKVRSMDGEWVEQGLVGAYLPFSHLEYGLFRALNVAAREAMSDTLNNVLAFDAADKLRHAQAICIVAYDLEKALGGFSAAAGRRAWLEGGEWQPVRRLIEQIMALSDPIETVVAVNGAVEPLLAEPLRHQVFCLTASRRGDVLLPMIAGTATNDWIRNASWTRALIEFLGRGPTGAQNATILADWTDTWRKRTSEVTGDLFSALETRLHDEGLATRLEQVARHEQERLDAAVAGA
jgi:methane monooxygenase component A beta chain/propane monooxygenase small subunit